MDNLLQRFLTKINVKDISLFEDASFSKLENDKENNRIIAEICAETYLKYDAYEELFDALNSFVGGFTTIVSFKYKKENKFTIDDFLNDYKEHIITDYLDDYKVSEGSNKAIVFYYKDASVAEEITEETRKLKDFLDSISCSFKIMTQEKTYFNDDFAVKRDENYQKRTDEAAKKYKEMEWLMTNYQPCHLADIEKYRMVIVQGKIFKIEDKVIKNNKTIRNIEYFDGTDSISSSLFESKSMPLEELMTYKPGVKIQVKGKPMHDEYQHNQLVLKIDEIKKLEPDLPRMDDYPEKRVELHLHTKMSAFDGVCSITDYVKQASKWGHKAIAITDHGVVQAFPEAQKAAKAFNMKVIYGSELYVAEDKLTYIYNQSEKKLADKDTRYVIFDLETTGLSCRYDRILEFGAVRVDNSGQILDEIDFFVNPHMQLSKFSIEVSHITQRQADSGIDIKAALKRIKEFFQDDILVAHNAEFDYGFLNEALKNNDMDPISNPVIDTLPISRYLFPDRRSHTEESLARELKIEFDKESAHRANYDAENLAKIFDVMLLKLTEVNRDLRHCDLATLEVSKEMIKGLHPTHLTVYVKNMDGLKDLYQIISESQINYMSKQSLPLVPKSYLKEMRDKGNILIGSGCLNGRVFEFGMTKSKEKLEEEMKFYDFIEVQPPDNYLYLINRGQLQNMENVRLILKDIIDSARSLGKMVCATGDCHYLNPEDKIYRDVFIAAKGLKGVRHPMNLAPRESESEEKKQSWYHNPLPNPDQHFRTTQEMIEAFSFLNDEQFVKEIVIDNTNKIADMIEEGIKPCKDKLYPPKIDGSDDLLKDLTYKTAKEMYGDPLPKEIADRLDVELHGIIDNGYSVIYWISSLLVRWSNDCGYMIGSRGSVGSSLVATMSGITEVNPLPPHYRCPSCHYLEWADLKQYGSGFDLPDKLCPKCGQKLIPDGQNIPFATFLGFHAEKVPDIDLNFPSDFQSTAHEYLKELLGKDNVYKAGTIQTTQDKNAIGYVKGYYESLGIDTTKVRSAELDRIALGCVDVKRTTGQHPGGIIVIPNYMSVYDFTPVQYPADEVDASWKTTHYDFHAIHDNVLKFDMLGHVDPQAIKMMCDDADIQFKELSKKIPINDVEALSLFWDCKALKLKRNVLQQETGALGLPEFGTENGRRTLIETKPRSFTDLVRISGLSHGTNVFAGNAEVLIKEQGKTLSEVIACRDDIMIDLHELYGMELTDTFKLMEIVRKGNFCKPDFAEKRAMYTQMMKEHNVPDYYIESCEKIQYLFPKGHAVAYVTQAVRCAWFKVHMPLVYYATYFTLRCDAYDLETMVKGIDACLNKRNDIIYRNTHKLTVSNKELSTINAYESTIEMYDRGYSFTYMSIEKSLAKKFVIDREHNCLIPPFVCIDGLGESVADAIVKAREEAPFVSVEDLKERGHVGDKLIEALRENHALDNLAESAQMTLF